MLTAYPDSRYDPENLSEIDDNAVARLSEEAEKMAYWPSPVSDLNATWEIAYEAAQAELLSRVQTRKAR